MLLITYLFSQEYHSINDMRKALENKSVDYILLHSRDDLPKLRKQAHDVVVTKVIREKFYVGVYVGTNLNSSDRLKIMQHFTERNIFRKDNEVSFSEIVRDMSFTKRRGSCPCFFFLNFGSDVIIFTTFESVQYVEIARNDI